MREEFIRFEMLVGSEKAALLKSKSVLVFGVGGVGGYVCEALARCGVGKIDIVDNDTVDISNINRQIIATRSSIGRKKTDVMRERLLEINEEISCEAFPIFFLPENADEIDFSHYDFVVDAIDTVSGKIEIIRRCKEKNVPVISSMGTGNKLDPTRIKITDIYKTSGCPLARVMRGLCRKNGIESLPVVCSEEEPKKPLFVPSGKENAKKSVPASSAFVPPAAGLTIAYYVVNEFLKQ